jgi:hypothetical protein
MATLARLGDDMVLDRARGDDMVDGCRSSDDGDPDGVPGGDPGGDAAPAENGEWTGAEAGPALLLLLGLGQLVTLTERRAAGDDMERAEIDGDTGTDMELNELLLVKTAESPSASACLPSRSCDCS